MAKTKTYNVLVDTMTSAQNNAFTVNTNDLKSVKLNLLINQDGEPLDLTDATVRLAVKKPDQKSVLQDATIIDALAGSCEIVLDTQAYVIPGNYTAEVMVFFGTDTVAVTSNFAYKANRGIMNDDSVESTNEWQSITQAIADTEAILVDLRDNGTGVDAQARADIASHTTQLADIVQQEEVSITKYPRLGNETDDTNRLLRAVAALSDGDTIKFPKGTFTFTNLTINKKISLKGWGMKSTILNFTHTNGQPCITYDNAGLILDNFNVSYLTIKGNASTGHGLSVNYGTNSEIQWVDVRECGGDGIHWVKGWVNTFKKVRGILNKGNGLYLSAKAEDFSEINSVTIKECSFLYNEKIGVVIGEETYSYNASQGYVVKLTGTDFTDNYIGSVQIAGERNVTIENNYFEITGRSSSTTGITPFHIYVGKRSGAGISTAHEINIKDNHFNSMNKSGGSTPFTNNVGYSIIADNVIGMDVSNNFFFGSVQGSILVKNTAKRVKINPNVNYEDTGIPFLTDQGTETVYLEQDKNEFKIHGVFGGESLLNQGAENFVQNGDFSLITASGNPVGYQLASFTFSKDTDGALICTSNGGSYHKLFYTLPSIRLEHFKGKYITLCVNVKSLVGNTGAYVLYTSDGLTEQYTTIPKDGNYNQLYQVRQIASNATSLKIGVGTVSGATSPVTDKIYVKSMRAFLGRAPQAYQYNPTDYPVMSVGGLPSASVDYAGRTVRVAGGAGVADILYMCLKSSTDTYSWKQIITG